MFIWQTITCYRSHPSRRFFGTAGSAAASVELAPCQPFLTRRFIKKRKGRHTP